jgi:hypothetical protein
MSQIPVHCLRILSFARNGKRLIARAEADARKGNVETVE